MDEKDELRQEDISFLKMNLQFAVDTLSGHALKAAQHLMEITVALKNMIDELEKCQEMISTLVNTIEVINEKIEIYKNLP